MPMIRKHRDRAIAHLVAQDPQTTARAVAKKVDLCLSSVSRALKRMGYVKVYALPKRDGNGEIIGYEILRPTNGGGR